MTGDSLVLNSNLVLGFSSPPLATYIQQKAKRMEAGNVREIPTLSQTFSFDHQQMEMWFLPDNHNAVLKVKQLIRSAQKTLKVAMFTWTRLDFAKEIVRAAHRGVQVEVALDKNLANGAGNKVHEYLLQNGIPVHLNDGSTLLHHKFLYIDDTTLVHGSANWTRRAFTENDDCFLILTPLTPSQQQEMSRLWKLIYPG
jgi:phosphatidylserine/phosphatidylglycerophosphate/cardiolipin synthase-like enzyme